MSQPEPNRETLDTAQGLTAAMGAVSEDIQRLTAYGRRNRRLIWGLVISIILDLALTVSVAIVAVQAHDANGAANQNRVSAIAACQSTNVARAQNQQLWDYLLAISQPRPGESAAQRARGEKALAEIRAKVATTFAPRDCQRQYPPGR